MANQTRMSSEQVAYFLCDSVKDDMEFSLIRISTEDGEYQFIVCT